MNNDLMFSNNKDDWETPDTQTISLEFEGNKAMSWESRSCNPLPVHEQSAGVVFYGDGGSILLESGNSYTVYDNDQRPKVLKTINEETDPGSRPDQQNTLGPGLAYDLGHVENFLRAIRESVQPNSEIGEGHKSVLLCQLGNIAYRTQSTLYIDQRNGHIIGNREANRLWSRTYEPGWEI